MSKKSESRGKQFRWSKPMERVLLEVLADEVKIGNRPNNTFRTSSFNRVSSVIFEKFNIECSSDHVEHHLRTVKTAWGIIAQLRDKSGFGWDDNMKMIIASPTVYTEHVQAHPTHEKYLNKKIEMYEEIALVVNKDRAKGNFAKSFNDVDLDIEPINSDADIAIEDISKDKNAGKQSASSSETFAQPRRHRKRGRDTHDEESDIKTISEKLGQVADAITRLTWDRLDVQALHDELMKMEGFDEAFLGEAFDYLVEHERLGKAFMAKSINLRRIWLEDFSSHKF
ncbi:uncharacterized protein At2g29880-like [Rhododendron vialii]|uniref:uncharacterized protein At2g29880-like n=1 Tax=Rhododendron vialii TaxID=182163 RepID=UPI00265FB7E1|nr:uncharacterized protein At2g29880-like [Rhododendron vialii]